ncbi:MULTISPECIES: TraB/GumN family protein [Asticcacaulis]|uniref:TraB/GumN family protein n=1 Tax=Asticcacaulis TaxID=76890 RepID=UPI001AE69965|nr:MULTISPECIES: TraB/GumN family protein [Asticcacaulis]MBP2160052.1 uncharacterized protein YbaP (TraB family) [Asticcacaulis solisilvae]MDR6801097.1 uncharacterized protein YbaP (TraB family) [Asticcacaulis sp. BE141]
MLRCLITALALVFAMPAAAREVWSGEVVISAKASGPALWRLRRGQSEVIVIGVLPTFPKTQAWRTRRIENALKGANGLLIPQAAKASAGDMLSLMSNKSLPEKRTLKEVLPPDLYARYAATASRAGVSVKDFERDKPVWAGARLRREVLEKRGVTADEPTDTITRLARRQNVSVKPFGRYKLKAVLKDVNAMNLAAQTNCMRRTLDNIDFVLDKLPASANAWSTGDMSTVLGSYRGSALADCLEGSGKGSALIEQSVSDTASAIDTALNRPGKTVAVVPLSPWLRKGGALDRLRGRGVSVTSPED